MKIESADSAGWCTALVIDHDDRTTTVVDMRMRMVPVIGFAYCGDPRKSTDIPLVKEVHFPAVSPRSFAVQVRGLSLSPRVQEGDFAVCMPTRLPRDNDLVVVELATGAMLLKEWRGRIDGDLLLMGVDGEVRIPESDTLAVTVVGGVVKASHREAA